MNVPPGNNLRRLGFLQQPDSPSNDHLPPLPALMLSLRFKSGKAVAFAYAHLYQVEYDGAREITLHFSAHRVSLQGEGLEPLYRELLVHATAAITERDSLQSQLSPSHHSDVTAITVATAE